MRQVMYERPREKLQRQGVSYLHMTELIQLVIGAGNAKISGAKLARLVSSSINKDAISLDALIKIEGMGVAKACQILASIELGRRLATRTNTKEVLTNNQLVAYRRIAAKRPPAITVVWFDGSMKEIHTQQLPFVKNEHDLLQSKRIFSEVVSVKARYGYILFSINRFDLNPTAEDLSLVQNLKDIAALLGISILSIDAVNKSGYVAWHTTNIHNF